WFSKPSSFNDPLDSRLSFKLNQSLTEYKQLLSMGRLTDREIQKKVQKARSNPKIITNEIDSSTNRVMNSKGIFSLSKTNDNILMWSHYAKNHTGIVIEFDVLEDIDFFTTPLNVSYQKSYQPLDYFYDRKNAVF